MKRQEIQQIGVLKFTVAADDNASSIILSDVFAHYSSISIAAPSTAPQGTISLASLRDPTLDEAVDGSWNTVQSPPGTDVVLTASKTIVLTRKPFPAIRLESDGTESVDLTYPVYGEL